MTRIYITSNDSNLTNTIMVGEQSTAAYLKYKVSKRHKVPLEKLTLLWKGRVLKDHEVLKNIQIKDRSQVHWIDNRKMTVALECKSLFSMSMEIHPSLLVSVFKARVAKKIGMPLEWFRLTYGKWILKDPWQTGDYNIQEGTYIQIHVKFSGGGGRMGI